MARSARERTHRVWALLIIAAVVISGGIGSYLIIGELALSRSTSALRDDGPAFFEAVSQVNGSVQKAVGGPWSLFSVFGIAAQLPFSPNVIGYPLDNHSVNTCGALFNGVTFWNGSIPVFTGTFNSGTAPFWQFAFYSNSSKQVIVATDVLGAVHVYTPESYPGACTPWNSLPGPLAWSEALTQVSVDSPAAAAAAWNVVSHNWPEPSEPFVQIMTLGPNIFDGVGYVTGGYLFAFERCGLEGVAGVQPQLYAAVNWSASDRPSEAARVAEIARRCRLTKVNPGQTMTFSSHRSRNETSPARAYTPAHSKSPLCSPPTGPSRDSTMAGVSPTG